MIVDVSVRLPASYPLLLHSCHIFHSVLLIWVYKIPIDCLKSRQQYCITFSLETLLLFEWRRISGVGYCNSWLTIAAYSCVMTNISTSTGQSNPRTAISMLYFNMTDCMELGRVEIWCDIDRKYGIHTPPRANPSTHMDFRIDHGFCEDLLKDYRAQVILKLWAPSAWITGFAMSSRTSS